MTPEAEEFLIKSRRILAKAQFDLQNDYPADAARGAYLSAFHAAQALIYERSRKVSKTHGGVHAEFGRLAKDNQRIDRDLLPFLGKSYDFKIIADYETGPGAAVSAEEARGAVTPAERFVASVAGVLDQPEPTGVEMNP